MSELIVQPIAIDTIKSHPNADRLEIAVVGGWEIITGKGNYSVGDIVVHVQPDNMVPRQWAETWGVDKYLSWKKGATSGRVRAARLRGIPSYGFLVPNESNASIGTDLSEHYGITKYEPPPPPVGMSAGQMRSEHPLFYRYTDIQNLRNYKDKLDYCELLVVTEKIHGTNSRIGWIRKHICCCGSELDGSHDHNTCGPPIPEYKFVAGTHRTQRDPENCGVYSVPYDQYSDVLMKVFEWACDAIESENDTIESMIIYGEIYGVGIQDLHYGAKEEKGYRVFDICINGRYLSWSILEFLQEEFGLPLVPVLDRGVFDFEQLLEIAQGQTTMADNHIREGIVIRPWHTERSWGKGEKDPHPKRMIFKLISDAYLLRKGGSEFH
jgi:RNA ligase (TIGR02306 family)